MGVEVTAVTLEIDFDDTELFGDYGAAIEPNWDDDDDIEIQLERRYGSDQYDLVARRSQHARLEVSTAVAAILDEMHTGLPSWVAQHLCSADKNIVSVDGTAVTVRVER